MCQLGTLSADALGEMFAAAPLVHACVDDDDADRRGMRDLEASVVSHGSSTVAVRVSVMNQPTARWRFAVDGGVRHDELGRRGTAPLLPAS